jgi:hypothetical protein
VRREAEAVEQVKRSVQVAEQVNTKMAKPFFKIKTRLVSG